MPLNIAGFVGPFSSPSPLSISVDNMGSTDPLFRTAALKCVYVSFPDQSSYQKHLHGGLEFVDSIPKSFTGKNLRSALRKAYAEKLQSASQ